MTGGTEASVTERERGPRDGLLDEKGRGFLGPRWNRKREGFSNQLKHI